MPADDALSVYVAAHATSALDGLQQIGTDDVAQAMSVELVHEVRTSLRRLRAMLRTAPSSFAAPAAADRDLRFVARSLSEVRDADVMTESLLGEFDALPEIHRDGPQRERLLEALAARRRSGIGHVHRRREDARWTRALDQLRAWRQTPPRLQGEDATRLLEDLRTGVRDRIREAGTDTQALHSARRAAKRWRYTAEMLRSAHAGAQEHYDAATSVHTRLGQLQDAVVAAEFLEDHVRQGARRGESVTAPTLLRENARRRIEEAVADAPHLL